MAFALLAPPGFAFERLRRGPGAVASNAMAPINYNLAIYTAVWAALFAPGTVIAQGCKIGNRIDERTDGERRQPHKRGPGDYLEIKLATVNDQQRATVTPTFGQGRVPNADAIMPIRAAFELRYTYEPAQWRKHHPDALAPEVEGKALLMENYPRLGGLTFIRSIEVERSRLGAPAGQTIVAERWAFDLRLHAASIRN